MLKALLIDDELNNLTSLEFLLQHDCKGIEVAGKALSAKEARKWLESHYADVIFLDINMPGENGFTFQEEQGFHFIKAKQVCRPELSEGTQPGIHSIYQDPQCVQDDNSMSCCKGVTTEAIL